MFDAVLCTDDQETAMAVFKGLGLVSDEGVRLLGKLEGTAWEVNVVGPRYVDGKSDGKFYWILRWNGDAKPPDLPEAVSMVWRSDELIVPMLLPDGSESDILLPADYPGGLPRFA